ncbi:DNA-binding transcriptional regulator, GntR family [Cupriavidus necator]|uniref:GntR family transcriptional regulator n=1 Tax=Cupriavidus necator (strain ATCC 17699 / DSM 428 / KCTC 22496 / NCIMB 10442 / H16 / Stanier 337) TaxID=381666 RepID=Q0KC74_CUPNH|nr:GntR family transcriptional regulator [Cupriavidus necator]QCC00293.1 GntR family transcriptional regulator [Cupriavidus necator H16]QQB76891.1 GntR family transcriptional regulator [Cupriavidus necator]WKA42149.1 GntR family transcriptional regulator [Cupriavidus necator]CAJ92397.1 transcriptional regulator, GntR-family [Cupriavidus necator H16]
MTKLSSVSDAIIRSIESGDLREGDRLPSEGELASFHGVSVGTVQKALARLTHSGLITREQGRGTFVSGTRVAPADVRYLRFRDEQGNELPSYVHARSVKRIKRKGPWSEFLAGDGYVRIERVISVGGRFDLYSEFWLREEDFAQLGGLDRDALEKNLRELIGQRLSLPTLRVDQWIRFGPAPAVAAQELGLDPEAPAFIMELRGYTLRDQPLYYQSVYAAPFAERLMIVREKST